MKRSAKSTIFKFEEPVEKRQKVEITSQSSQVQSETSQEIKHYEPLENGIYWTKVSVLDEKYNEKALYLFDLINRINPIASIHFNFNMDVNFIIRNYPRRCREIPISLVIGRHHSSSLNNSIKQLELSNVITATAKLPIPYGTHHTKLSMFESENAVHVVISTANLISEDWTTNAFYYVRAPFKESEHTAEQSTSKLAVQEMNPFQRDLIEYLKKGYSNSSAWKLVKYWVDRLSHGVDFSAIKDRIIASVPGRHLGPKMHLFGHMKLRKLLSQKFLPEQLKKLKVKICQFSSIGSMGGNPKTWLGDQFLDSLSGGKEFSTNISTSLKLIFPTAEDVRTSLEGYMGGGSLMNYEKTSNKQPFMISYLHQWRSDNLGRTHAMPHIKTFTALESADGDSKPAWIVITSANLSQAAWGTLEGTNSRKKQLFIRSYELGVLLCADDHPELERLPLPYDLPLTKYSDSDRIWITDGTFLKPDINGNSWSRPE